MSLRLKILIGATTVLLLSALAMAADWFIAVPADSVAQYVGRETCAECHQSQHKDWLGSHHDLAMDLASPNTVIGDFEDQEVTHVGLTSRMFQHDDKYFIHTEGPDGEMDDFEIKYVIGVDPLQQYMVEFDDGRIQVLRESWDAVGKRWIYQYPPNVRDERLKPDDPLHWTGRQSNWNHMCAECHTTNLHKNYDVDEGVYRTTYSEIDVSCETCHGPGSIHVDVAKSKFLFWDRNHGYGLPHLKDANPKWEIESCAKCHMRRRIVHGDFHPGREMMDYYAPAILRDGLYHADGQILDEVYVYGSFVQSKMFAKGIRCTDCHDPHTARLKHEGNKVCTSCHQHPAGKYDVPAHHHHPVESTGASCVECHMPSTHYMIVDPRRDHSLRVPRPDLSVELGTPNACTACHLDTTKSDDWEHYADWLAAANAGNEMARDELSRVDREMAQAIEKWYDNKEREIPHYARAFSAARRGEPGAAEALTEILQNKDTSPIVRATAIHYLAAIDTPGSRPQVVSGLTDPDPLVRSTAVLSLEPPGTVTNLRQRYGSQQLVAALVPLLSDASRLVRTEAAQMLAPLHRLLRGDDRDIFLRVLDEYREGQLASRDQPEAHLNLGNIAAEMGDIKDAIHRYKQALKIDENQPMARLYLGVMYSQANDDEAAEREFRTLTEKFPEMGVGHHRLGMVLARMDRFAEAEAALLKSVQLEPQNFDFLYVIGVFYLEQENWQFARKYAEQLVGLYPNERRAVQLLRDAIQQKAPAG